MSSLSSCLYRAQNLIQQRPCDCPSGYSLRWKHPTCSSSCVQPPQASYVWAAPRRHPSAPQETALCVCMHMCVEEHVYYVGKNTLSKMSLFCWREKLKFALRMLKRACYKSRELFFGQRWPVSSRAAPRITSCTDIFLPHLLRKNNLILKNMQRIMAIHALKSKG